MNNSRWVRGFTIIEVLIVLAIAGLILLIVFLAVPAMQRSARNTHRKRDAAMVSAQIASLKTSYQGIWLNRIQNYNGDISAIQLMNNVVSTPFATAKLGYYIGNGAAVNSPAGLASNIYINQPNTLSALKSPAVVATNSGTIDINHISVNQMAIYSGENCDDAGNDAGTLQNNSVAIFYATETGGNNGDLQCLSAY